MTFDANERATELGCWQRTIKVICGPCALVLAQSSFDDGVTSERERAHTIITLMRARFRDDGTVASLLDAVVRDLQ